MSNNFSDSEMDPSVWQQMVYKSNYTETINKQMRVPDTITVVEDDHDNEQIHSKQSPEFFTSGVNTEFRKPMEVPDRIVVSVGESGVEFSKGERDFSKIVNPSDELSHVPVSLQTPPRVLTLQDRNLDSLDINLSNAKSDVENSSPSPYKSDETTDQCTSDDQSTSDDLDEVSTLRREVMKLNKEVAALKENQSNQTKIDYCVYGVSVALWLLNGWFLYSNRRLY